MSSAAWNEVTALWSSWTITWVAWLRTRGAWSVPFRFSISNKDGLLQMDAYPSQALLNHVRRNYGWKQIWTNQPLFQWVSRKKRRPREENELDEHSSRGYNLIRKQNKPESTLLTPTSRRISLKRAVSLCYSSLPMGRSWPLFEIICIAWWRGCCGIQISICYEHRTYCYCTRTEYKE